MTKKTRWQFLVVSLLLFLPLAIQASNTAEEGRIQAEIRKQLKQGEIVELEVDGQQFIGIYQKSALPVTQGAVLILHGLDQNPDSPAVIKPIRNRLAQSGWDTLAMQMPIPSMDSSGNLFPELEVVYPALATEAVARINAAVKFFEDNNNSNLAIVGHGLGANMAISYLANDPAKEFQTLVAISLNHNQPGNFFESLSQLKLPVLDIYGSRDIRAVVSGADSRKKAIVVEAENSRFRQYMIEGANHYFTALEAELVSTVRAWLKKTSPVVKISSSEQN
jgi:dienelactone hydrolase